MSGEITGISINDRRRSEAGKTVLTILEENGLQLTEEEAAGLIEKFKLQIQHCLEDEERAFILDAAEAIVALRRMAQ